MNPNTMTTPTEATGLAQPCSDEGKARLLAMRGEPWFYADWDEVLMLHYRVDPDKLQANVPFELDLWNGEAYVSLVAFSMRHMRLRGEGRWREWLMRPVGHHPFLNVRTYVKHRGERGIYFMAEWLPNLLSRVTGPPLFGLPYRWGRVNYQLDSKAKLLRGEVRSAFRKNTLKFEASTAGPHAPCQPGSLAEFLMERYTAFTSWHGWKRVFRIWHAPWLQCAVEPIMKCDSLIRLAGPWAAGAQFAGANYSPGAKSVWMSRPYDCPA